MNKPIRVLHVVTIMNLGGIETFLMTLYRNIDRTKVQFDFLVHRKGPGVFDEEIKSLGGRIIKIQALSPLSYFSYKKELISILNQGDYNYNIIHSHLNSNSSVILSIAKSCGIKFRIAHAHIDKIGGRFQVIKRILRKKVNIYANHRFACAQGAGKFLYGDNEFIVINNAVESGKFVYDNQIREDKRKLLNLEDKIVFGNVSRFNTQKNHSFLIEVFEGIHNKMPNAHLILVGDGDLKSSIMYMVKSKQLENAVSFLGVRNDVHELLSAMDYILMPSFYEGLPVSLIEAQASGLKIFASETITSEVNITNLIEFLSIDNPQIWVDHILNNLDYKRENMSERVRDAGYDVQHNAEQLEDFYLNLVS